MFKTYKHLYWCFTVLPGSSSDDSKLESHAASKLVSGEQSSSSNHSSEEMEANETGLK